MQQFSIHTFNFQKFQGLIIPMVIIACRTNFTGDTLEGTVATFAV